MLQVVTDLIPIGHPNRPGIKLSGIKARVHHGTANFDSGATDIANGRYAGRAYIKKWDTKNGKYIFYESDGVTPFRFGVAHVYIDKDSAIIKVPLDEVTYSCGERNLPYDNGYKGQTKLAYDMFNNQQNYYTLSIELCMNDMGAWDKVLANAIEFITTYMPKADIPDLRHFDLTGKNCPSPLVGVNGDAAWNAYKEKIRKALITPKVPNNVPIIRVNGEIINNNMDVQPFIKDGRIMVPVRFIAEALGKKITWIASEKIVDIR
jgi:hypothetical protein